MLEYSLHLLLKPVALFFSLYVQVLLLG